MELKRVHKQGRLPRPDPENPFGQAYYEGGQIGGFEGGTYQYDRQEQQQELAWKWDFLDRCGRFKSILFVGCALGFEVRYARERGKEAYGADISKWAIEHADPSVRDYCWLYDGRDLSTLPIKKVDLVASFDVLAIVKEADRRALAESMMALQPRAMLHRLSVLHWREEGRRCHGIDGVLFRLRRVNYWIRLFERDTDYACKSAVLGRAPHWRATLLFRKGPPYASTVR